VKLTNSRRTFLLGAGIASAAAAAPIETEVAIIGGGTAGSIAAIQAGRLGARTVLIEAGSQLGGTMTTAGVSYPGLFHAWGRQIIAGIGWDLVCSAAQLNSDPLPDFSLPYGTQHWKHQVHLNGGLYAALAEEACLKAGVEIRYYESPLSIARATKGWRIELAGKGTRLDLHARQLIDCTGNGAAIALAGLPRRRDDNTQPGTLMYRLGGYDLKHIDLAAIEQKARDAVKAGVLESVDFRHSMRGYLANGGDNAMHIPRADSSTSELHTRTNIRGRQSLLRMMRFLKPFPGFEKLRVERLPSEAGVRETFRIVGETVVTVGDITNGRKFDDAVAYSFYPIDLHDEQGIRPRQLKPGTVPTIPLGALIPAGSQDVLVAGRLISSDRLANSALRVQASSMAMGQAAGAAAALAARTGVTPSKVPLADILKALRDHGAITPA
jgi:glycine/D-amino acid oxidase-like deaminating enzyme